MDRVRQRQKTTPRRPGRLLPAVLALGLLAGCRYCQDDQGGRGEPGPAGIEAENDRPTRQLTIGIQQEPDTLWPIFHEMMVSEEILGVGQVSLTLFDDNLHIQPSAATEVPTLANGGVQLLPDGRMRVTWHIDPSLSWPDGTPLSARDFIFAHELMLDPRLAVPDRDRQLHIASMTAGGDDGKTLIVVWKQVYPYYHSYGIHPALPRHVVEPLYKKSGAKLLEQDFGSRPMLAGSFTVREWVRGSHIIVERNPTARGKWRPWLDRIIFRVIPSTKALEANLLSGTIDAVSSGWLSPDRVDELERKHPDSFRFYRADGLIFEHIDCKLDHPDLADVRVRRALLLAADRQAIAKRVLGKGARVAHSWLPPRRQDHNSDVRRYELDVAGANKLLDEAGYVLGADGVRHKEGRPLRLSLMSTSGNAVRETIEQMLQRDWKAIGVDLEIRNQPAKIFFSETLRQRKFEALALYAWAIDPVADSESLWRCDRVPRADNGWRGQNYSGWCNGEVTAIHQEIQHTLDPRRRAELLRRQQMLWAEALPALPLYFQQEPSVTIRRLSGWKPSGSSVPVTWNVARWKLTD